tara:strand:- start:252 stop:1094 length:843 start_codon:yes stop_codon:yes gene_type:complete
MKKQIASITLFGDKKPLLIAIKILKVKVKILNIITSENNLEIQNFCQKNKINFFDYKSISKMNRTNKILIMKTDFALSFSYPYKISSKFIKFFKNKIYNFHPADLPFYRGNLPTTWPILDNKKFAYYTLHLITIHFDQGPIISKVRIKIGKFDTGISLYKKLLERLPDLVLKNINKLINSSFKFRYQDEKKSKFYKNKIPNNGFISSNWEGKYIERFVRAFYSRSKEPARTILDNHLYKLYEVKFKKKISSFINDKKIFFKCPDGYVIFEKYKKIKLNNK